MSNRDFLLKDICDENFRTKLKRTVTNDRSAPLVKAEGEILKTFRTVEKIELRPDMIQQCDTTGPPAPPPPPPSFSLIEIKLHKSDGRTPMNVKKRAAVEIGGQPDRNALMEQIKGGKFKLKKVGNSPKEDQPREIVDQLQKDLQVQPAIEENESQKSVEEFDRAPNNVENAEKIGKIKISPLFQAKNEILTPKDKISIATNVDEKPKSPTKSMQIVAQMTKMLENSVKEPSPPIKNGRFFADVAVLGTNPESDAKFSPVDQELARSTIMNVLSKKMTSQDFIINQKSKYVADENSENSKTLRSADSVESLSSGSISLNSEFAESVDSKISSSNGSTTSTSKISALRMNFQQNGGRDEPSFFAHRTIGDSNFLSSKITPKNDISNKATSKFGATLSRMKSLEVLPTNNGVQKLKIYNNTINDERQEKSLSPPNRKIYDSNPIPFPKLGTLKSRFEYSSTSTLPGLSPTKSLGRAPILSQNSQLSNQSLSTKTLSNPSRQSSNNEENLYTATPIFVNLSKKSPISLAKNVSPDSGHSSPKNGHPVTAVVVETWRVKKDSLENNLFTGSDPLANGQRLGVSKRLENLYESKKNRTIETEGVQNVEIIGHQNGRSEDCGDEISTVLQKPLSELMQYQFQIDLCKNGTNDLIRLEKRVTN
uniref:WH2 domain-containing protein n=1 Tax=Romanomermis culicivorax TaxID=13658 RepID=A0A915ILI3_ROMCU